MKNILLAIIAISAILVVSVTTTSMMSLSNAPAYAKKCTSFDYGDGYTSENCSTQGKNPSTSYENCYGEYGCDGPYSSPNTHRETAQIGVYNQQLCKQVAPDFGIDCETTNGK
ncbi:hypothetical protein [Candidatus Nitrosocosmicus sp. R]